MRKENLCQLNCFRLLVSKLTPQRITSGIPAMQRDAENAI
jgi:hypothetical protein